MPFSLPPPLLPHGQFLAFLAVSSLLLQFLNDLHQPFVLEGKFLLALLSILTGGETATLILHVDDLDVDLLGLGGTAVSLTVLSDLGLFE